MTHKTLADIGEFGLIERLKRFLPGSLPEDVVLGIGDDCAIIRISDDRVFVVTCDMQVDTVHFRSDHTEPYVIGRRAMSVNLSDIAAMGATPRFALVSLGLPEALSSDFFDRMYQGLVDRLTEFGGVVIGGNFSRTDKIIIDLFIIGEAHPDHILTRSGAQPGDRLFVTGCLGSSAAGQLLLSQFDRSALPSTFASLINAHLNPTPRVAFAKKLAEADIATAAIDISDGLAADLGHLCDRSQCDVLVRYGALPFLLELDAAIEWINQNNSITSRESLILQGGEDYELLFTIPASVSLDTLRKIANQTKTLITEIGRIAPRDAGRFLELTDGSNKTLSGSGWDHYSPNRA